MRSELPRGWIEMPLGDLISVEHGYAFKSEFFCDPDDGVPIVVSVGNFEYSGGFRFQTTQLKGYSGGFPDRFRLRPDDILLVMTCQTQGGEILGIPARLPDDGRLYLHNQRLGRVIFRDADRLDADFAYWLFLYPVFNQHLCQTATGSKILHTAPGRIESYTVALPPIKEQARIGNVLGLLANKIDSNRRLAAVLEEIAEIVFRARFVDFVDVEEFEDSELGRIPRGWQVGVLGDLARFAKESIKPFSTPEVRFEHFSIPAFDNGRYAEIASGRDILSSKTLLPDGDCVLVSKLNPATKRVWLPPPTGEGPAICSPEFLVLVPKRGVPNSYLYALLAEDQRFYDGLLSRVTGTTGSRQRVKPVEVLTCQVLLPDLVALSDWNRLAQPMYDQSLSLLAEERTLAAIRDALLPKLISGETRVPDTSDFEEVIGPVTEELAAATP